MPHQRILLAVFVIVALGTSALAAQDSATAPTEAEKALEDLCTLIRQQPDSVAERQVVEAVDRGAALGRPFAAEQALRHYLASHPNPSLAVRRKAIDSARRIGDYNTAMVRCKGYLEAAQADKNGAGPEASRVAAMLYWLQIDLLNLPDDAYRAMGSETDKLCTGSDARKFDAWYLEQARRRGDYAHVARRLAEIHASRLPTAQTQHLYASYVDWLLGAIAKPAENNYAAADHVLRLAQVIQDDERIKRRCALYAAHLKFAAATEGQEPAQREKQFAPVLTAAGVYLAKFRDADALHDVMSLFGGKSTSQYGTNFSEDRQGRLKREFFATAFGTLPTEEQQAMLRKSSFTAFASKEQWTELAAKYAQAFRDARGVPLSYATTADCRRLVPAVQGSNEQHAVLIRALATGGDFFGCLNHLVTQESWHQNNFDDFSNLVTRTLRGTFESIKREEEVELPGDYYQQAMVRCGARHVVQTPLALGPNNASEYLYQVWSVNSQGMEAAIDSLAWVPYTQDERKRVYEGVYAQFVRWADETRKRQADRQTDLAQRQKAVDDAKKELDKRQAENKPKDQIDDAQKKLQQENERLATATEDLQAANTDVARIGPLEAAFKRAMQAKSGNAGRAPNPLCRHLTELVLAAGRNDARSYLDAARKLYPLVKDYEAKRTPTGKAIYQMLLRPRAGFDLFEFQLEVLVDRLKGFNPDSQASQQAVSDIVNHIMSGRTDWAFGKIPAEDRDRALKLHDVLADALSSQIDRGRFSPWLWDAVRGTRYGPGWGDRPDDLKRTAELVDKMIQRDVLANHPWRSGAAFATTTYMWLVRNEAKSLAEKYPVETCFDERFLKEAAREGYIDEVYFQQGGRDEDRKIRDLAAELVAKIPQLPVDARDPRPCHYDLFGKMQSRAMDAQPEKRDAMLAKLDSTYGKTRFDAMAMGLGRINLIGDINNEEAREDFFAQLSAYLNRARAANIRVPMPNVYGFRSISSEQPLSDAEMDLLLRLFSPEIALTNVSSNGANEMVKRLVPALVAAQRQNDLFEILPHLWKIAAGDHTFQEMLVQQVIEFQQRDRSDLAAAASGVGLEMFESYLRDSDKNRLRITRAQAMLKIGEVAQIDPQDPRYAILAAQADYLSGNFERAWQSYLKDRNLAVTAAEQLDPSFVVWLIRRNTVLVDFDVAEELAREALQRMESQPEQFTQRARAELLLAYADIALARPDYPRARALYGRIAAAEEFTGTRAQVMAELQVAEVDRITKHYGEAIGRLEKLMQRKDRFARREAHFYMARVLFDQQQYVEALREVETVFHFDPTHAEARIFEGRVNLRIKRLERASRINVGFLTDQQFIVPGDPLRVGLRDQALAIAGGTRAIEMRAWTDSGDEEHFSLVPFADSRTQFEGQVATALGPINKDDHTLQLSGNDRVYYDFSENFKQVHNVGSKVDHYLVVLSDADLYASSGKILSKDEMEQQALERAIRAQLKIEQQEKEISLGEFRPYDQVKPGNPINVRVIDPDQNVTGEADRVSVILSTTSGDRVTFDLEETGTHTGIFDAAVPTASALATAIATDSEQGSHPLFAISAGNHPPWVAQPDNKRPKTFAVDLNASEQLGTMKIDASVPGRRLKQFLVQTSVDGKKFETIGSWPSAEAAWHGTVRLERLEHADALKLTASAMQEALAAAPPDQVTITELDKLDAPLTSSGRPEIMHIAMAFHFPTRQMATFQLKPSTEKGTVQYTLLVDGQKAAQLSTPEEEAVGRLGNLPHDAGDLPHEETALQFKGVLGQGVHRIDVYVAAGANTSTGFQLLRNTDQPPYLEPCPMEMFDPQQNALIARRFAEMSADVTAAEDGGSFDVTFGPAVRARVVRLLLADFETDAPAIEKIHMVARDGRKLLPTDVDLMALKTNQVLEIVPGDTVSVVYRDPRSITERNQVREAFLSATYANGSIDAALLTGYGVSDEGLRRPEYVGLRRFKPEDTIMVVIDDADADTSADLDTIPFTMKTADGDPVELQALETDTHSGVFLGKIFVVEEQPQRKSEIRVAEGEDLVLAYIDRENTDPGIPWERSATIESVVYVEPELRLFNTESTLLSEEEIAQEALRIGGSEFVPASRTLAAVRPSLPVGQVSQGAENPVGQVSQPAETPVGQVSQPAGSDEANSGRLGNLPHDTPRAVMGAAAVCELLWPTIVQTTDSTAEIFVQTSSGRKQYGKEPEDPFDIHVPGTLRIVARPGNGAAGAAPPGYRGFVIVGDPNALDAMDDGRFTFSVPLRLGPIPEKSFATEEAQETSSSEELTSLVVRGGDEIFVGFKYVDDEEQTRWIVGRMTLSRDAFFHVMNRQYSELVSGLYVGQSGYFRVIDPAMDVSDDRDRVTVTAEDAGGQQRTIELIETFEHSGVFKGPVRFLYADEKVGAAPFGAVGVTYGQQVDTAYQPGGDAEPLVCSMEIFKGADGEVQPFTKRFEDPLTAVRTRLTIAEAYFELAKKHRELGQDALTEQEIATGKRLLEEALRDYPDTEARAQVDYLLANLSLEFAEEADDEQTKKEYFREALERFSSIVSNYRDSTYAPKAQFKKALTLEQMGEIDRASEEYVKLSYRWPDSPLIAETIARLGQYFYTNGLTLKTRAEAAQQAGVSLAEQAGQTEDAAAAEKLRDASAQKLLEAEKARRESGESFVTAAKVFGQLAVRFPSHRLADKTTALSAQCFMRAERYEDAVAAFRKVIDNDEADKELRAESSYWAADSYMRRVAAGSRVKNADLREAYGLFKDLTLYYPESKWARYARGRLAGEDLAAFEPPREEEP